MSRAARTSLLVVGNGGVSGGAVTIEESADVNYTGAWTPIGAATTVLANACAVPVRLNATAKAVRARISTLVAGGTVAVHLVGR